MTTKLHRSLILEALVALDAECAQRGITGEICIYGGASMVLVFDAREATRDVDAVFQPTAEIREAALTVSRNLNLPADWLNDGVKGFVSGNEALSRISIPELDALTNLRILWPTPEYILAMKCMAARVDDTATDRGDVAILSKALGLTSADEVLGIVERFFPKDRIHIKTVYFVQEILASLEDRA
jgi:hypothetical protein